MEHNRNVIALLENVHGPLLQIEETDIYKCDSHHLFSALELNAKEPLCESCYVIDVTAAVRRLRIWKSQCPNIKPYYGVYIYICMCARVCARTCMCVYVCVLCAYICCHNVIF